MDELKRGYRIATIIGIAMIASVFIYAFVVEFIKKEFTPFVGFFPFSEAGVLKYILLGITISEFFLIRFIRNLILSGRGAMSASYQTGQSSASIQRLITMSIITYALCESVAIYGLVLFFLAGDSLDFYTFMFISLIYFAMYFPRYSQWEGWVK
ncbi:MAG: hypothetical protein HZA09_04935 [Nitrospirae bacterium]|nr:hypothetical protein [Nitrospirota bacterium]